MAFLRCLWTDCRRGGGWLILVVLVIAALVTDLRYVIWDTAREGTGAPTWFRLTAVGTVIVGTYPLVAAYGAWLGSRAGRARTLELEGAPRRYFIGSAAPSLTAIWLWVGGATALIYLAAATYTILRARHVNGRLPQGVVPWQSGLVIIAAMVATASIGYLLGRLIPNVFVPVLAAAGVFFIFQLPSMFRGQFAHSSWLESIIPTNLTVAMAPYIGDHVYPRLFWTSLAWFLCLIAVVVSALAMWRIRKGLPALLVVASLALSTVAAVSVVRAYEHAGAWHAANRGMLCIEHTGIMFCSPPAAMSESDLQNVAEQYDTLIPTWFPRELLPKKFAVAISGNQVPPDAVAMADLIHRGPDDADVHLDAWVMILSGTSKQQAPPDAAQLVTACALLRATNHDCGSSYPDATYQLVPNMSQSREGQTLLSSILTPGKQPTAEQQQQLEQGMTALQNAGKAKLDSFLALPDSKKVDWLKANWDRLRAGDLTLEDLP